MVPLSWALSRALRYRPSDPKHYIAYQLLRWRYGNVSKEEKHYAHEFVISATRMMDQRFLVKLYYSMITSTCTIANVRKIGHRYARINIQWYLISH